MDYRWTVDELSKGCNMNHSQDEGSGANRIGCEGLKAQPFNIMSYNAGAGLSRPEQLVAMLRSSGSDIVGLQELEASQSRAIEDILSIEYPYQVLYPAGFEGKGLVSRFPILEHEQISLYPGRPDLRCVIDLSGVSLTVIVAHPPPPISFLGIGLGGQTKAQIEGLIHLARSSPRSVILGDFNATSWQNNCTRMRGAGLVDSFRLAGRGRGSTIPRRFGPWRRLEGMSRMLRVFSLYPFLRVDYIWHTPDLHCLKAWVGDDAGSDHLPVLAQLALRGGEEGHKKGQQNDFHL